MSRYQWIKNVLALAVTGLALAASAQDATPLNPSVGSAASHSMRRNPAPQQVDAPAAPGNVQAADQQPHPNATGKFPGFRAAPYTPAHAPGDTAPEISSVEGDFNHDGCQDIVSFVHDQLTLMTGDCKGHFTNAGSQATALNVYQPIAVDLNHDGYPDIVAMTFPFNYGGTVVVLLNQRNGTFAAPVVISKKASVYSGLTNLNVVDLNGDGNPDVIISGTGTQDSLSYTYLVFQVITGNSDGSFNTAQATEYDGIVANAKANFAYSGGTVLRTVNGQLYLYGLVWQSTNVNGTNFGSDYLYRWAITSPGVINVASPLVMSLPTFNAAPNKFINFADLNGDGIADFTLLNGDGMMFTALGKADGTFGAAGYALPTFATNNASVVSFRDVDGDGNVDAILAGQAYAGVWPGNGDGTFRAPRQLYVGGFGGAASGGLVFPVQNHVIDDFDGDGVTDIAFFDTNKRGINFLKGKKDATFIAAPALINTGGSTPANLQYTLSTADLNGDGNKDLIVYNQWGFQSALSDGKGNFTYQRLAPKLSLEAVGESSADFNKDGKDDILGLAQDQRNYYHLYIGFSNGDGTVTTVDQNFPYLSASQPAAVIGDINGDGYPDVVVAENDYNNKVYLAYPMLNDGKGNLIAGNPVTLASPIVGVALADLNGDGKADLALNYGSMTGSTTAVYLSDGTGKFATATPKIVQSTLPAGGLYAADATGDGKADLLQLSNGVMLYPGNGDGTFAAPVQIVSGMIAEDLGVADLNGDGIPDIYFTNNEQTLTDANDSLFGLLVYPGLGGGTFAAPRQYAIYGASSPLFPLDFMHTGALSLLANGGYGTTILQNLGSSQVALSLSAATATQGQSVVANVSVSALAGDEPIPTGTVTLLEDGKSAATATLGANGSASLTVTNLTAGTHVFTATYSGDSTYVMNPYSNSSTLPVAKLSPAFSISSAANTLTLSGGASTSTTINLSANVAFAGPVTLTCSAIPAGATCGFSQNSVTLAPGQTSTSTVSLSVPQVAELRPFADQFHPGALACGLLFVLPLLVRRRKRLGAGLLMLAAALLTLPSIGCAGNSNTPHISAGAYTLSITATPGDSTISSQTVTMIVNVQK